MADRAEDWNAPDGADEAESQPGERWPEASTTPDLQRDAGLNAAFASLLRTLRTLPGPCAPPVGAGAFDILFACEREVVVWYSPARDGVEQREVAIPGALLRAAWALTLRGAPVEEPALRALAAGAAGGRWLQALLAQVPGVETRQEAVAAASGEAASEAAGEDAPRVTLIWRGV